MTAGQGPHLPVVEFIIGIARGHKCDFCLGRSANWLSDILSKSGLPKFGAFRQLNHGWPADSPSDGIVP